MSESIVQVAAGGTGPKMHTNQYTVGANNVEDEVVVPGPYPYATYCATVVTAAPAANDHLLCLNAGATLKVRVHRIKIQQLANANAVHHPTFHVLRTTTGAPTGGTAVTPAPFDTSDAASGAAGRSIPGVKGTESTILLIASFVARQAELATASQYDGYWEWRASASGGHGKAIVIPAGTTNGLVIKNAGATSTLTTYICEFEFTETAF